MLLYTLSTIIFIVAVAGAAPYGVFPNQPQLYATQGPPPPTYDQTLTHPMVRVAYFRVLLLKARTGLELGFHR